MINILIIEDIKDISDTLITIIRESKHLLPFVGEINVVKDKDHAEANLELYPNKYQLIFWDILLNGVNSISLAVKFPPTALIIVFSTDKNLISSALNDFDNIKQQTYHLTAEEKEALIKLDINDGKENQNYINKNDISNDSEIGKVIKYVIKAEKKYGDLLCIDVININFQSPLIIHPMDILYIMNFDDDYLSLDRGSKEILASRKIIFTKDRIYLTDGGNEEKKALENYLDLNNKYSYFSLINRNSLVNIHHINSFKNRSGFRDKCVEMNMPLIREVYFFTDGRSKEEKADKESLRLPLNHLPHYVISTKNDFNILQITPTFKEIFKNKYRNVGGKSEISDL